jgi:hypothetical protein
MPSSSKNAEYDDEDENLHELHCRRTFIQTACSAGSRLFSCAPRYLDFNIGITTNTRGGWEKDLIVFPEACWVKGKT